MGKTLICNRCSQPIKWGKKFGAWTPLDPTPDAEGRYLKQRGMHHYVFGVTRENAQLKNRLMLHAHDCHAQVRRQENQN